MKNFQFYQQPDTMDCGPTCLRMVAKHYKRSISLQKIRKLSETTRSGSSLQGIADAAEKIGFRTLGVKINFQKLQEEAPLPCIVFWNERHFVVVYKITKNKIFVADPAHGLLEYSKQEFIDNWIGKHANEKTEEGIVLLLEPTPKLSEKEDDDVAKKEGMGFLWKYLSNYKRFMFQLGLGLFSVSILQLIFPFLTQSVVDIGIQNKDLHFLYLVLFAQLFIFLGRTPLKCKYNPYIAKLKRVEGRRIVEESRVVSNVKKFLIDHEKIKQINLKVVL